MARCAPGSTAAGTTGTPTVRGPSGTLVGSCAWAQPIGRRLITSPVGWRDCVMPIWGRRNSSGSPRRQAPPILYRGTMARITREPLTLAWEQHAPLMLGSRSTRAGRGLSILIAALSSLLELPPLHRGVGPTV